MHTKYRRGHEANSARCYTYRHISATTGFCRKLHFNFNVKLLETSEHYQCYVVTYTTEHTTIHHSHLVFHITPLHIRNINGLTAEKLFC